MKQKAKQKKQLEEHKKQLDAIIKEVLSKEEDTPSEATTEVTSNTLNENKADLSKLPTHVKSMVQTLISNNYNVRIINFAEHCHFHNASTQTIFKVTVDGGADTCLDGAGYIFLEYTERSVHVIGFDNTKEKKERLKDWHKYHYHYFTFR